MSETPKQVRIRATRSATGCLGAVLAGGRSRRMGDGHKALHQLAGRPLATHVIERLQPQVDTLVLSVERVSPVLDGFGLPQVGDPVPGSNGPLGGLAAVIARAAEDGYEWVQLAPCDAPFLPPDLTRRLRGCANDQGARVAVVRYRDGLQPVFSLWHVSLRNQLQIAVTEQGLRGFREFLAGCPYVTLDWPEQAVNPFFNINDRTALARAGRMLVGLQEDSA